MENLIIIKTLKQLEELSDYIKDKDFIAFDTETDGLNKENRIIGFSICADVETAYYVILYSWNKETSLLEPLETLTKAKWFLSRLIGKSLILQNATFDCWMVNNNFKLDLMPSVHTDTLMLGHLLNENRSNGLKERGEELFGKSAKEEQDAVVLSSKANGGTMTKELYELYKADADIIALYGAKDAILTLKLFYHDVEILFAEGLDKFFYEDETMPLLRGPTYDLNTTGLRVDPDKLQTLKASLEADIAEATAYILNEIKDTVKHKYPGDKPKTTFNINSNQQLAWLLFGVLNNPFDGLTKGGKDLCKKLGIKPPYTNKAKREFIALCLGNSGAVYEQEGTSLVTGKKTRAKKYSDPWKYMECGSETLGELAPKYKWVAKLLEYKKNVKLLSTYVEGIQERMNYGIIRPGFLQHGTTSGRYSSSKPNFQNLPRDDKRVKACIVARRGKVFVGADYEQLEPRVFASFSGDVRLQKCFSDGDDFYSVIGVPVFGRHGCTLNKSAPDSFAKLHPEERQISKAVALSATYGTTSYKLAPLIDKSVEEAQEIINDYFENFPSVKKLMLDSHEQAMKEGKVYNLYGRPRRMPEALNIKKMYGNSAHADLPYEARNTLNLAINHRIQSTGASIINRSAIAVTNAIKALAADLSPEWAEVKVILNVHDELILEGPESLKEDMITVLKDCMENTVELPGVKLIAQPKAAYNLADLK